MIDQLKQYHKMGYSIIPINTPEKKPFIKWAEFQERMPDFSEIEAWWEKWPDAGVGIVTGKISGITVIDIDNEEGEAAFEEYISDSFLTPTSKSPHGRHYYFRHCNGLPNKARVIPGCDIRNDGGYIIAPPSKNGHGKHYEWFPGCQIGEIALSDVPKQLKEYIFNSSRNTSISSNCNIDARNSVVTGRQMSSDVVRIERGNRDEMLFHLANHLVKGSMPVENIRYFLQFFASKCDPPFSQKETEIKINSAINRAKKTEINLSHEVREYVMSSSGVFMSSDIAICLQMSSRNERKNISKVLSRMLEDGLIERTGNKNGQFRRIETESPDIDIFSVKKEIFPLRLPLGLDDLYLAMPKNIIIVAGTQDAGKTAFMLRTASLNMNRGMKIRYLTSEMGGTELVSRLEDFDDIPLGDWENVNFKECATNFQDYIIPDAINIIDYLEVTDSFWLVGEMIRKVFDKLDTGICVIALQKDFKTDLGRGGSFGLEKPRLYVTLTSNPPAGGLAKIVKCKNWKIKNHNPNGRECVFKIRNGNEIRQLSEWEYPIRKEK